MFINVIKLASENGTEGSDEGHSSGAEVLSDGHFLEEKRHAAQHHRDAVSHQKRA